MKAIFYGLLRGLMILFFVVQVVLLVLVISLFFGCALNVPGVPAFETPVDAFNWVYYSGAIIYKSDAGRQNCQTPEETLALRTGDCEDLCLLTQAIIHDQFNLNCWMALGTTSRPDGYHAEPWMNGWFNDRRVEAMGFKPITYLSYTVTIVLLPVLGSERDLQVLEAKGVTNVGR
jgi:hypothetical protein